VVQNSPGASAIVNQFVKYVETTPVALPALAGFALVLFGAAVFKLLAVLEARAETKTGESKAGPGGLKMVKTESGHVVKRSTRAAPRATSPSPARKTTPKSTKKTASPASPVRFSWISWIT